MDRYIIKQVYWKFALVFLLVVFILSLENLSRLISMLDGTEQPGRLLIQLMVTLIPEYASFGIFVALFLAISLTVRRMIIFGEWQVFYAVGISPWRIMVMPFLLSFIAAILMFGVRMQLQPVGEQKLADLGTSILLGKYGLRMEAEGVIDFPPDGVLVVDGKNPTSKQLQGLFLQVDGSVIEGQSGSITHDGNGHFQLNISNGRMWPSGKVSDLNSVKFGKLKVNIDAETQNSKPLTADEHWRRVAYFPLVKLVSNELANSERIPMPATSKLLARSSYAIFCLLIPLLAVPLAIVPNRSTSSFGIVLGVISIIVFVRGVTAIETIFVLRPVLGFLVHITFWFALAILCVSSLNRGELGATERWFNRLLSKPALFLRNLVLR